MLLPGQLNTALGARTAEPSGARLWWRRLVHALAIVAGWGLFFWGWQRVLAGGPDFSELRLLMLGAAVVVPVITISWILHNRGIHRRKGPRRSVAHAQLDYRIDFHGHAVVADFRSLAGARCVEIVIEGAMKRYRVAGLPVTPGVAAVAAGAGTLPAGSPLEPTAPGGDDGDLDQRGERGDAIEHPAPSGSAAQAR